MAKGKKASKNSGAKVNRRQFLKIGSATAALGAVAAVEAPKKAAAQVTGKEMAKSVIKEHKQFPHEICSIKPFG